MIPTIFQAYKTLEDYNVTTLSGLFTYVAGEEPVFVPIMLFSIFIIVTLSVFFGQKRTTGDSNFFGALSIAGFLTFVVSIIMSLIPNLINIWIILVCLAISIVSTFLYLMSRESDG